MSIESDDGHPDAQIMPALVNLQNICGRFQTIAHRMLCGPTVQWCPADWTAKTRVQLPHALSREGGKFTRWRPGGRWQAGKGRRALFPWLPEFGTLNCPILDTVNRKLSYQLNFEHPLLRKNGVFS